MRHFCIVSGHEKVRTNDGVLALLNAQGFDDHRDTLDLLFLCHCAWQPEHGRIVKHLPHCQSLMQQVILHTVDITSAVTPCTISYPNVSLAQV